MPVEIVFNPNKKKKMEVILLIRDMKTEELTSREGKKYVIQTCVGEMPGSNPESFVFKIVDTGDGKIERIGITTCEFFKLRLSFKAREYKDRWYMDATCWDGVKSTSVEWSNQQH